MEQKETSKPSLTTESEPIAKPLFIQQAENQAKDKGINLTENFTEHRVEQEVVVVELLDSDTEDEEDKAKKDNLDDSERIKTAKKRKASDSIS